MNEPFFGSGFPTWPMMPSPGFGWAQPQGPITNRPVVTGQAGVNSPPTSNPAAGGRGLQPGGPVTGFPSSTPGELYGLGTGFMPLQSPVMSPGFPYAYQPVPGGFGQPIPGGLGQPIPGALGHAVPGGFAFSGAFPTLVAPDLLTGNSIPALLAGVALRRGQPLGPTNDQEIEDFAYDAFELVPGTNDVEVRCENGRATLTGAVQHKRLKHDIGEIVWAIPGVNDVQNNITITVRRRARAGQRETEGHTGTASRK
jgi:hypothetical protein